MSKSIMAFIIILISFVYSYIAYLFFDENDTGSIYAAIPSGLIVFFTSIFFVSWYWALTYYFLSVVLCWLLGIRRSRVIL